VTSYLDASFLVSMYVMDSNAPFVSAVLSKPGRVLMLSSLGQLEVTNALELGVFRKELTRSQADQARVAFENDIKTGWLRVVGLEHSTMMATGNLILRHTAIVGCRTSDIVHVATALELGANEILTFDVRQKELARRLKLQTN
jgi:predicted nucleic acid-binding protein